MRHGLFDIGVAAGADGFDAMKSVLKIRGGDDDGLHVLAIVKFIIVARHGDLLAGQLGDVGRSFLATPIPNVGHGDELKIQRACHFRE